MTRCGYIQAVDDVECAATAVRPCQITTSKCYAD
jgi:hypothetical protein